MTQVRALARQRGEPGWFLNDYAEWGAPALEREIDRLQGELEQRCPPSQAPAVVVEPPAPLVEDALDQAVASYDPAAAWHVTGERCPLARYELPALLRAPGTLGPWEMVAPVPDAAADQAEQDAFSEAAAPASPVRGKRVNPAARYRAKLARMSPGELAGELVKCERLAVKRGNPAWAVAKLRDCQEAVEAARRAGASLPATEPLRRRLAPPGPARTHSCAPAARLAPLAPRAPLGTQLELFDPPPPPTMQRFAAFAR